MANEPTMAYAIGPMGRLLVVYHYDLLGLQHELVCIIPHTLIAMYVGNNQD